MVSDMDRELLALLADDGRRSLKELAEELNVAVSTVRNHIEAMQDDGVIEGFTVETDSKALGFTTKAIIAARLERGSIVEIQEEIASLPNVLAVYDVTGRFDTVIICQFMSVDELDAFIKEELPQEHVQETETFVALNTFTEDFTTIENDSIDV